MINQDYPFEEDYEKESLATGISALILAGIICIGIGLGIGCIVYFY